MSSGFFCFFLILLVIKVNPDMSISGLSPPLQVSTKLNTSILDTVFKKSLSVAFFDEKP